MWDLQQENYGQQLIVYLLKPFFQSNINTSIMLGQIFYKTLEKFFFSFEWHTRLKYSPSSYAFNVYLNIFCRNIVKYKYMKHYFKPKIIYLFAKNPCFFFVFVFVFWYSVKLEISTQKSHFQLTGDDVYPNVWLLLRINLLTHVRVEN